MSALLNLFGDIESNNGLTSSNVYQTSPAFEQQFGSGETGVNNFFTQALTANPTISVGDLYGEYNAGTGTPGSGVTFDALATLNPAAYANASNKLAAAGIDPSTPASSLFGPGLSVTMAPGQDGSAQDGDQDLSSTDLASPELGTTDASSATSSPAGSTVLPSASGGGESFWTAIYNAATNLGTRAVVLVLGAIVMLAALFLIGFEGYHHQEAKT